MSLGAADTRVCGAETHLGAPGRWMPLAKRVEMSLDPAGRSACATKTGSLQIPRHQEF
jgi:hypothetical protein